MNETVLQRLILAQLGALEGVKVWRMNTGAARVEGGRVVYFGRKGQADVTGIARTPDGRGVRLEIETKNTGRQSKEQREFEADIRSCGGFYVVARKLDDALIPVKQIIAGEWTP